MVAQQDYSDLKKIYCNWSIYRPFVNSFFYNTNDGTINESKRLGQTKMSVTCNKFDTVCSSQTPTLIWTRCLAFKFVWSKVILCKPTWYFWSDGDLTKALDSRALVAGLGVKMHGQLHLHRFVQFKNNEQKWQGLCHCQGAWNSRNLYNDDNIQFSKHILAYILHLDHHKDNRVAQCKTAYWPTV